MFAQSFGRALAAVTLIGALASTGAVVPTEPQGSPTRRYSQGGLEIDLPGDWQPVPGPDSDAWNGLTLGSAATRGAVVFIVWLPLRDRSYFLGSFESFVKEKFQNLPRRRGVKRLKVSGLDAVSFSLRRDDMNRGGRVELHETWIGVPEEDSLFGTVFRFFTVVEPSGPRREAELIAYERMLTSMRIDPVKLHQQ
jgi:hypothetical protein